MFHQVLDSQVGAALQEAQCVRMKRLCSAMNSSVECLEQNFSQLDGYPQLALVVRAIKYLGIYRQEALPKLGASCDNPCERRYVCDLSLVEPSTNQVQLCPKSMFAAACHALKAFLYGDACTAFLLPRSSSSCHCIGPPRPHDLLSRTCTQICPVLVPQLRLRLLFERCVASASHVPERLIARPSSCLSAAVYGCLLFRSVTSTYDVVEHSLTL